MWQKQKIHAAPLLKIPAGFRRPLHHLVWGGRSPPHIMYFAAFASACIFCFCTVLYLLAYQLPCNGSIVQSHISALSREMKPEHNLNILGYRVQESVLLDRVPLESRSIHTGEKYVEPLKIYESKPCFLFSFSYYLVELFCQPFGESTFPKNAPETRV